MKARGYKGNVARITRAINQMRNPEGHSERHLSSRGGKGATRQTGSLPPTVPDLWDAYFLLKGLRTKEGGHRAEEVSGLIQRIQQGLRQRDRSSLGQHLGRQLPSLVPPITLDKTSLSAQSPYASVTGTAMPDTGLLLVCSGIEYRTRSGRSDGRFAFRQVQLSPGDNPILIEIAALEGGDEAAYQRWRSLRRESYETDGRGRWALMPLTFHLQLQLELPFLGLQDPVLQQEWQPADLPEIVRCGVCRRFSRDESWHDGACPFVEARQCRNRTGKRYTHKDLGFYPEFD